jgi:hypothetical protein
MPAKLRQLQNVIAHEGPVNTICLGQRTGQVFATGGDDRHLFLWAVGSNNHRASFGPLQSSVTACRFDDSEAQILCGNNGGTVMLFDLNGSRCQSTWAAHRSAVHSLVFHSQNPKLVLSCGYDGRLHVLSTQQRRPIQTYNAHGGPANYVAISSDGRYAATCGDDRTVRIFDLTAQRQLMKFDSHSEPVTCVDFHPTDPLLVSCGCDRSTRFFDLTSQKEVPVSFHLDSSPVDVCRFIGAESLVLTASGDYLKVVGWNPPEFFDHFALGLERVHDLAFVDRVITIASATGDHVLVHRMATDALNPFTSRQQIVFGTEPKRAKATTPQLIDINAMPALAKRTAQLSDRAVKRAASAGPIDETQVFQEFRKGRAPYMATMNEKFSRLTRVNDMLYQMGLAKLLQTVASNGDLGSEVLLILRMKPQNVKLEHASFVMQIAVRIFDQDQDLAIASVEAMLQAFGKLVHATKAMASRGNDVALEERKKKCNVFLESFREIAPRLKTVAGGPSASAQTAAEILEEWRIFLR